MKSLNPTEAASMLFQRHGDEVYRYIRYTVGGKSEADDILQEVFLRVLGIILVLVAGVYTYYNGTFWGKASAEKQIPTLLQRQYGNLNYHQHGGTWYNFKTNDYGVTVTFDRLPSIKYFFELRNGTLDVEGTTTAHAPIPVPDSTTWVNQDIHFNQSTLTKIQKGIQGGNVPQGTYMLTGGLGMADPEVDSVSSNGSIRLQTRDTGYVFELQQHVPNPANWRVLKQTATSLNVAEQGTSGKPLPWVKQQTQTGQTYYKWNARPHFTWFYFVEAKTFMVLRVTSPSGSYPFPEHILNHLQLIRSTSS